jgi:hypothetical protein
MDAAPFSFLSRKSSHFIRSEDLPFRRQARARYVEFLDYVCVLPQDKSFHSYSFGAIVARCKLGVLVSEGAAA